jgi:archaemetzincin
MSFVVANSIIILTFGFFEQKLLASIISRVELESGKRTIHREGRLDLSEYYDPVRRQYNGDALLSRIESGYNAENEYVIGLFNVDLFIPILTYIFGQAYLNGRTGIVSMYRLSNERYGLEIDDSLMASRLEKEVIHELGHMFGLVHCIDPVCVMRAGNYVEDIDQKGHEYCRSCREKIPDKIIKA